MKKPHIFISYTNTGSGHRSPALSVAEAIEKLYPDQFQITCDSFFESAGLYKFDKFINDAWDWILGYPILNFVLIWISWPLAPLTRFYLQLFHPKDRQESLDFIRKIDPDIIFTTHFFTHTLAIDARKKYHLDYPIISYNPDAFDTFPQWDTRGDILLVCSDVAYRTARLLGHKKDRLKIVAPALRLSFDNGLVSRSHIIKKYHLDSNKLIVCMSDGGQGIGNMLPCLEKIIKADLPLNILAICGKNETLFYQLTCLKEKLVRERAGINLVPFSYTDEVPSLVSGSDVFIGKGGPSSVLETLVLGTPTIINYIVNTGESKMARVLRKAKIAWVELLPSRVASLLKKIILDPTLLDEKKKNIIDYRFYNGSEELAHYVVGALRNKKL